MQKKKRHFFTFSVGCRISQSVRTCAARGCMPSHLAPQRQAPESQGGGGGLGQCGRQRCHRAGWRMWTWRKPGFVSVAARQTCLVLCCSEDRVNGQAYNMSLKSLVSSRTTASFKSLISLLGCTDLPWDVLLEHSFKQQEGWTPWPAQ